MAPSGTVPWPPDDIHGMLAEMRSDHASAHWERVRWQVLVFARRYGERSGTYLDNADDLTQQVMELLLKPGKLEAFGRETDTRDTSLSQERPLLRQRFLAWLAIITRRTWQNRARYYDARPDLASHGEGAGGERAGVVYVGGGDEHARWEPPDPQADVAERVDWRLLLESVVSWMATLQTEDEVGARKVAQLLLVATSGVSYEEVARRFDCKVTQVRDAVHSIRLRLR